LEANDFCFEIELYCRFLQEIRSLRLGGGNKVQVWPHNVTRMWLINRGIDRSKLTTNVLVVQKCVATYSSRKSTKTQPTPSAKADFEQELEKMRQDVLDTLKDQEKLRFAMRQGGVEDSVSSLVDAVEEFQNTLLRRDSIMKLMKREPDIVEALQTIQRSKNNLFKALQSSSMETLGTKGDKFNSELHEIVGEVKGSSFSHSIVYQVVQRGWSVNGKVWRPAQVIVATPPSDPEPSFLERVLHDKTDEADDLEHAKQNLHPKTRAIS
jgi:molecular chaperone GrpE